MAEPGAVPGPHGHTIECRLLSSPFHFQATHTLHLPKVESGLELSSWAESPNLELGLSPLPLPLPPLVPRTAWSLFQLGSFQFLHFIQLDELILSKISPESSLSAEDQLPNNSRFLGQSIKEPSFSIPAKAKPLARLLPQAWPGGRWPECESSPHPLQLCDLGMCLALPQRQSLEDRREGQSMSTRTVPV